MCAISGVRFSQIYGRFLRCFTDTINNLPSADFLCPKARKRETTQGQGKPVKMIQLGTVSLNAILCECT